MWCWPHQDGLKMGVNPKAEVFLRCMWIIFSLTLWISWTEFRSLLPGMRGIFSYKLIHWLEQTFVTGMWCSNRVSHCQEAVTALPTSLMVNSTFSLPLPNRNVTYIKSHAHHPSLAASGFTQSLGVNVPGCLQFWWFSALCTDLGHVTQQPTSEGLLPRTAWAKLHI